ncbi:hypothetical protein [Natronohydrobacter thiooxidans]|uniref:hypothetical protein n=1 Tax=Natronohydrobacter thiooxidans TaxID=87172 RepID=UPI000A51BEA2|nr:hypothetical protein [Natronohydrobacter thiooxidans]
MDTELRRHAAEAISRLREAMNKGGDLPHAEMSHAISHVIALRNRMLEAYRDGALARDLLDRANALTSLAYGTEFPLAGVHADRIEQTCQALNELLEAASAPATPR